MHPPHILLALGAACLTGCSPLRLLDVAVPRTGYEVTRHVAYDELKHQQLDVYRPAAAPSSAPVVLFLYRGRWSDGDKSQYRFVAQALVSKALIAVAPAYRLYPHVRFAAFIQVCAKAVRW